MIYSRIEPVQNGGAPKKLENAQWNNSEIVHETS